MLNAHPADLTGYDIILVNSSAGKDSQAMLHYVATLARELGILDRVHVVHAELEEEWQGTKELAAEQAAAYGLPFHVCKRKQGSLLAQVQQRGMWPGSTTRFCTSDHKRDQVSQVITKLAQPVKQATGRPARILNCLGIRAAESTKRRDKAPLIRDRRLTGGGTAKVVDTWLPIFTLSVQDVWAVIKVAGTRHHPAYDLGMPRLSCCFCVFAPKAALILAGQHNPELLKRYVAVEQQIGHSFRKDLKISEVLTAVECGEQPGPITTWEM